MHLSFMWSEIAILNIYPHCWHILGLSSMCLSFVSPEIVIFNLSSTIWALQRLSSVVLLSVVPEIVVCADLATFLASRYSFSMAWDRHFVMLFMSQGDHHFDHVTTFLAHLGTLFHFSVFGVAWDRRFEKISTIGALQRLFSVVLLSVVPEIVVCADFTTFLASRYSFSMVLFLVIPETTILYVKPHFGTFGDSPPCPYFLCRLRSPFLSFNHIFGTFGNSLPCFCLLCRLNSLFWTFSTIGALQRLSSVVLLPVVLEIVVCADFTTFLASLYSFSIVLFLVRPVTVILYMFVYVYVHIFGIFGPHFGVSPPCFCPLCHQRLFTSNLLRVD